MDERAWKLKKMLMKKELIPEAKESNLLHWEARQQIRYMNEQDPLEWTPERIAQEFPISVNGARVRPMPNRYYHGRCYDHEGLQDGLTRQYIVLI